MSQNRTSAEATENNSQQRTTTASGTLLEGWYWRAEVAAEAAAVNVYPRRLSSSCSSCRMSCWVDGVVVAPVVVVVVAGVGRRFHNKRKKKTFQSTLLRNETSQRGRETHLVRVGPRAGI